MSINTLFADTIVNIGVANGMVRIDLGVVGPEENVGGERKSRLEITQRVVMPLEGFVRSLGMQQQVVAALNDRAKQAAAEKSST